MPSIRYKCQMADLIRKVVVLWGVEQRWNKVNVKYNNLATQRYYKVTISDTNKTLSIYLIFSSRTVPFTYWALQQNKCNCLCFHRPGFLSLILFKGDYFYNGLFLMLLGYQSIKCRYYVNANCFHNIIYCDNLTIIVHAFETF